MRGQGLPISAVVLIIIAVSVLVLALVFIVFPIAHFHTSPPPNDSLQTFTLNCETGCGQIWPASGATTNDNPIDTTFCQDTYDGYNCYSTAAGETSPIATCTYTADNGKTWSDLDAASC